MNQLDFAFTPYELQTISIFFLIINLVSLSTAGVAGGKQPSVSDSRVVSLASQIRGIIPVSPSLILTKI